MIILRHPVDGRRGVARRLPSLGEMVAVGAAIGAALSVPLGPAQFALPLAVAGGIAGAVRSYWKVPDAPVCRIWRVFRGCGGSTANVDKRGNSGPPRYCWGHPGGRPRRLVNLIVVPVQIAVVVGLLFVVVAVAGAGP